MVSRSHCDKVCLLCKGYVIFPRPRARFMQYFWCHTIARSTQTQYVKTAKKEVDMEGDHYVRVHVCMSGKCCTSHHYMSKGYVD